LGLLVSLNPLHHSSAATILSNLPGTGTYHATQLLSTTQWAAINLTLGGTAETFDSFRGFYSNNSTNPLLLEGGIYSNVSGHPGSLLSAFGNVSIPGNTTTPAPFTLTTTSSFVMQPSTSYWFVVHDPPAGITWAKDSSTSGTTPIAAAGHTFG